MSVIAKGTIVKQSDSLGHNNYYYQYLFEDRTGHRVLCVAGIGKGAETTITHFKLAKAHEVAMLRKEGNI